MAPDGDTNCAADAGLITHAPTVVPDASWWLRAAYALGLTLIVVGPLLSRGYLLQRDAVSTPRSYLTDAALGLGDAPPRAVPQDALVAALSHVVDGGVLVSALLGLGLWAAGWGAAALARELLSVSIGPQLVACTAAVWNPYVAERLLQGHWSLLVGYGALPWTALAAHRLRTSRCTGLRQRTLGWAAWAGCLAAGALTPTGALLTGVVGVPLVGRRRLVPAAALWCAASAPWLVATALSRTGTEAADPAGVAAFAARAEPLLGTLGSLAGLGGIWNADAVPLSRTTPMAFVATALLLLLVATGVAGVARHGTRSGTVAAPTEARDQAATVTRRVLLALSAFALVLPALGATSWGLRVGELATPWVPGAGLLRDTQKYVALAVPAYTLCVAAGCRTAADTIAGRRRRPAMGAAALLFVVAIVAPLPDLAWGVAGALRPTQYPQGWRQVAGLLVGDGDVAVLPAGMFRKFAFLGATPVLDPAPRLLPRTVLQTGELRVHGGAAGLAVAGESPRALRVQQLLLAGAQPQALAAEGVGWVLWERTTAGPLGAATATLRQLHSVWSDADLALYQVPGPIRTMASATPLRRATAVAAHLVWAVLLGAGVAAGLARPAQWALARMGLRGPTRKDTGPPSRPA